MNPMHIPEGRNVVPGGDLLTLGLRASSTTSVSFKITPLLTYHVLETYPLKSVSRDQRAKTGQCFPCIP